MTEDRQVTIDDKLIGEYDHIPPPAIAWNQVTSNQSVRAVIAIVLTGAMVYQVIAGLPLDNVILTVISVMIGYYFGENAPQPPKSQQ